MFPRRILALLAILALSLIAVADGLYLTMVHIDLEFGGGGIGQICHALSETGCAVTGGRFGALFGAPVSVIGAAGALTCAVLALVGLIRVQRARDPVRDLLLLLGSASVLASALMATLTLIEGKFCPFCVLWYGLNIGVFAAAWIACTSRQAPTRTLGEAYAGGFRALFRRSGLLAILTFAIVFEGLFVAYGWFHDGLEAAELRHADQLVQQLLAKPPRTDLMRVVDGTDDLPRLRVGPEGGEPITVVEFSDFQCPYCKRAWRQLEAYAEVSPQPLELVYVHYPLHPSCNPLVDREIHPDACDAARASECARRDGKFWEYARLLFADQRNLERDALVARAETLGLDRDAFTRCLDDITVEAKLLGDIALAGKFDVHGTPTLQIGGYRVRGVPRRPAFDRIVNAIVERRAGAKQPAP